jgi:hypothetical protein
MLSMNLQRRRLNDSQCAIFASRIATLRRGDNQRSPIGETSQADAADLLNVGKGSVEPARVVHEQGRPGLPVWSIRERERLRRGRSGSIAGRSAMRRAGMRVRPRDAPRRTAQKGGRRSLLRGSSRPNAKWVGGSKT